MRLTFDQLELLKRLAKEKGPVTAGTLKEKGGIYSPTLRALVSKDLVRIRTTAGRTDRYEIRVAGRDLAKAHPPVQRKYS